jgi:regulator of sigma E protease
MIFSPSTGLTNKWVVLKPYLIFFPRPLELGSFGLSQLYYRLCLCNEPITIPALDGGHVMFYYKEIFRVKPSDVLENAQMVGFVLLISLLLFANGNDIC